MAPVSTLDPRLPTSKTAGLGEAYVVRGRKDHRCDLCGFIIPKSDPHWSWRLAPGMNGSDYWFVGRTHPICHRVYWACDWFGFDDGLPDPGDFRSEILAYVVSATSSVVAFR